MSNEPIFHLELLKNYQVIDRPGTFMVSVAYDITQDSLYTKDDYARYLIPLRVIRARDLPTLILFVKDHGNIPYRLVRDYFLTGAIFENDGIDPDTLPIKGERVVATFDYINDILQCTHIKLIDRDELEYVNFSAIDDLYQIAKKLLFKEYD